MATAHAKAGVMALHCRPTVVAAWDVVKAMAAAKN